MFSRFSVSVFVERKRAWDILENIMQSWIGAEFGVLEGILSDNGGDFTADEIREVCSILNDTIATTGIESPFQNGLCERNHAIVDNMLRKMVELNLVPMGWIKCHTLHVLNAITLYSTLIRIYLGLHQTSHLLCRSK